MMDDLERDALDDRADDEGDELDDQERMEMGLLPTEPPDLGRELPPPEPGAFYYPVLPPRRGARPRPTGAP